MYAAESLLCSSLWLCKLGYLRDILVKLGFGSKWLSWMEVGVFESIMCVLVNGSNTMDFKVGKWLRQGDKLSPFLFSILAERLARIVKNKIRAGMFRGLEFSDRVSYNFLQFADDTLLMGETFWGEPMVIYNNFEGLWDDVKPKYQPEQMQNVWCWY